MIAKYAKRQMTQLLTLLLDCDTPFFELARLADTRQVLNMHEWLIVRLRRALAEGKVDYLLACVQYLALTCVPALDLRPDDEAKRVSEDSKQLQSFSSADRLARTAHGRRRASVQRAVAVGLCRTVQSHRGQGGGG